MFFLHQMLHLKIYIGETSHSSDTEENTVAPQASKTATTLSCLILLECSPNIKRRKAYSCRSR